MATATRLTDQTVMAAKPGKHRDGGGHGLVLVVEPSGARRWGQRGPMLTFAGTRGIRGS